MPTLVALPVELLHEIQLFAASHALPQTCKSLRDIFRSFPPSYRARYLIACVDLSRVRDCAVLTKMLRYPLCNKDILEAYFRITKPDPAKRWAPELPRRLFRSLLPNKSSTSSKGATAQWADRDPPLPFLRYLYSCPYLHPPDANSHDGYALTKAVQAGFVPLVRFLLDHGATPEWKDNLPVLIAIHRKDLGLVRMLVERTDTGDSNKPKGKRRKLEDRVAVNPKMLRAAVKCRAQDIVEYLTREKGCIPDMQTLLLMR
ncbi:hypothetical protein BU15DRAFT_65554 [Melanogaster broomeanus]|nr:hypothetical protein BU15DRAFT_65554 [Melanogaster broomeanus]